MVRPRDPFWEHAEEEGNGFRCIFCKRVFAGGIPRIKSHLSGVKGRGIAICTEVPEHVQAAALSALDVTSFNKAKIAIASSDVENNGEIMSTSSKNLGKHSYHNSFPNIREKDKSMVHKELAKFIMSNNIDFDVVESQSFVDFIKGVAECGLSYKLPSSMILKTEFVPNVEQEVEAYVEDVKKSWATTGCTIMFHRGRKSVDLYAYCPKGAVFLNSYRTSRKGSMDVDVKSIVDSVIEEIRVEHVVQFITNDVSAFCLAGELLDSKFPKIYNVQCVADMLHLLFKDIYEKVGWVKSVIDYAKLIVEYMYEDATVLSLMKQYTNDRELKHPCVNKCASNYQMLQRVLHNETGLRQLVASVECGSLDSNKTEKAVKVRGIITEPGFWREGREVLKALEPLIQVLCLVEDEGATSGYLYAAVKKAKEAIEEYCSYANCNNRAKMILELFEERRMDIVHPAHAAAAFLNPSYMCHDNFEEDCKMKDGINFMIQKMVADQERKQFAHEVQLYRSKVPSLFTVMAKEMLETSHPCVWWEYCGDSLPVLKKYALQLLSQPCKCLWEQKFSASEDAQTKKINRAQMNMKLMEKFRTLQEGFLVPMDLEKIRELPDYDGADHEWTDNANKLSSKRFLGGATNEVELLSSDDEAYVQQSESNLLKPTQLEQEHKRARQQDIFVSISGEGSHSMRSDGVLAFDVEYARWLEEQNRLINELKAAVNLHAGDSELCKIVGDVIAQFNDVFRLKGTAAKADILPIVLGMWMTPVEQCFNWIGGFRPSDLLKFLLNQLDPLTEKQLTDINRLQQLSRDAEDALSQGCEVLRQSLAETLASCNYGNVADYKGRIALGNLGTLEGLLGQNRMEAHSDKKQIARRQRSVETRGERAKQSMVSFDPDNQFAKA